jgi:hypothetical protein
MSVSEGGIERIGMNKGIGNIDHLLLPRMLAVPKCRHLKCRYGGTSGQRYTAVSFQEWSQQFIGHPMDKLW